MRITQFLLSTIFIFALATVQPSTAQTEIGIAGIWQTQGYGWVIDIQPDSATFYQATSASCLVVIQSDTVDYAPDHVLVYDVSFPGLANLLDILDDQPLALNLNGDTLEVETGTIVPWQAHRLDDLPTLCETSESDLDDPLYNFDVFWHMFNENYAFFDLYDVDWQAIYAEYQPQVTVETTPEALSTLFTQMIADLDDGHVFLLSNFEFFAPAAYPDWTDDTDEETITPYIELALENYLVGDYTTLADDQIIYGWLAEDIGYINILTMAGYEDGVDDLTFLVESMPIIMANLAEAETLVIDVRFNEGGADLNSVYIAGYFTDTPQLGFSKQVWDGAQFLEPNAIYVQPKTEQPFTGDVYVLTSGMTASAGEIFTMSMRALPNVTLVGETTSGALSDITFVFMPNSWFATLSNERYIAHDGQYFESLGVPPNIEAFMSKEALDNNIDPILDTVLTTIQDS